VRGIIIIMAALLLAGCASIERNCHPTVQANLDTVARNPRALLSADAPVVGISCKD